MVRRLIRFLGLLVFVMGLGFLGRDLASWVVGPGYRPVRTGQLWFQLQPASLSGAQEFAQAHLPAGVWDPAMVWVLMQPVCAVLAVLGLVLVALFGPSRRRR